MALMNLVKTTKSLLGGKRLSSTWHLYDSRYPPSKFFDLGAKKVHIHCIFCGFPRTGSNWIRKVLSDSTGYKTGKVCSKHVFPIDDDNIKYVKIHARSRFLARARALWLLPAHRFDGKYIYSYRDPRDAIISLYEMYKQRKGCADLSTEEFLADYDPIGQYRWEVSAWVRRPSKNVLLVKFENLKENPHAEFKRIFNFLGIATDVNLDSIHRPVNRGDSTARPRGAAYGWKQAPAQYQSLIATITHELKTEIQALGYPLN